MRDRDGGEADGREHPRQKSDDETHSDRVEKHNTIPGPVLGSIAGWAAVDKSDHPTKRARIDPVQDTATSFDDCLRSDSSGADIAGAQQHLTSAPTAPPLPSFGHVPCPMPTASSTSATSHWRHDSLLFDKKRYEETRPTNIAHVGHMGAKTLAWEPSVQPCPGESNNPDSRTDDYLSTASMRAYQGSSPTHSRQASDGSSANTMATATSTAIPATGRQDMLEGERKRRVHAHLAAAEGELYFNEYNLSSEYSRSPERSSAFRRIHAYSLGPDPQMNRGRPGAFSIPRYYGNFGHSSHFPGEAANDADEEAGRD